MISPIHFQQATTPRDIDRLYPVEQESFEPGIAWPKDSFVQSLKHPKLEIHLAVDAQEQAVGYALFNYSRGGPDQACIDSIAVSEAARGQKVGEQLLLYGLDQASQRGYQSMQLEVENTNGAAIHLYEKYGFQPSGSLKGYYNGRDGQEMQLQGLQTPEVQERIADNRQRLLERLGQLPSQLHRIHGS